jgi:hypothetical protein
MEECFICCTIDGKSDEELFNEICLNRKMFNYPLISLSQAFMCKCINIFAHNKCLLKLNKCPTCRKIVSKPNLYVKTKYDYIFGWVFNIIKKYPILINITIDYCIGSISIIFIIFFLINKNTNNFISMNLIFFWLLFGNWSIITIIIMKDYFCKYWLYNNKLCKIDSSS